MRLWTIHPRHLDARGLVALWREGLLAKAVLEGKTRGYRRHPQLTRFRAHPRPRQAMCAYLRGVLAEARARGYRFDASKLPARAAPVAPIAETRGQLDYEWRHLLQKLRRRDPVRHRAALRLARPAAHLLFRLIRGGVREWEKVGAVRSAPARRGAPP